MHAAFRLILTFVLLVGMTWGVGHAAALEPEDEPAASPPSTPVGKQLQWVMAVLNGAEVGDIPSRFTPGFLESFTPAMITAAIVKIRDADLGGAPIKLLQIEGNATEHALTGFVQGPKRKMSVYLSVDDETGLISGLRFNRAGYILTPIGDWDAYNGAMGFANGQVSFGAYEVIEERAEGADHATARLVPIHQIEDDRSLAIGSTFKLFILGTLAEQIEQGKASWDEKIAIQDKLKSLPSGVMQTYKAGGEYALSFYADRMIAISDNTATDHLLARAGRENVEQFFRRYSESPEATLPLLSTREMFNLKLAPDRSLLDRYIGATEDEQRAMVAPEGEVAKVTLNKNDVATWESPIAIRSVEWFASAHEIARVLADLRLTSKRPGLETVWTVLTKNPGMQFDRGTWKQIGYKGGSEPGVLSLNWMLERDDGRWFVLSIHWNDPAKGLDEERMIELAKKGIDLMAKHGRKAPNPEESK